MVSNIPMKKYNIYTLTLDYTRTGEPTRITRWGKLTHREAMRKIRRAVELGDGGIDPYATAYPLQRWQLDSGWQPKTENRPTQAEIDNYDSIDHDHVE